MTQHVTSGTHRGTVRFLDPLYRPVYSLPVKKGDVTRARIVEAARRLFEAQGYTATGLKQILEASRTPRGSFYFHFPGGKEQLGVAVVEAHGQRFGEELAGLIAAAADSVEVGRRLVDHLVERFEAHPEVGDPVFTVANELGGRSDALRRAATDAFEEWCAQLALRLFEDGVDNEDAEVRARVALATVEGALVMCRAYGSAQPLKDLHEAMPRLLGK